MSCGYGEDDALLESERCLLCPEQPCVSGCPVNINIPGFIQKIGQQDFRGAYDVITATNLLPAVCGRVCPQESQCEGVCTVGESLEPVAIGRLERWVGDRAIAEGWTQRCRSSSRTAFRVGIVGSGPAGMACAADMAKAGCDVTVFEAFHQPGGVLRYGIPDFRLPNDVVDAEIGISASSASRSSATRSSAGSSPSKQMIDEMGFDAVFIGTGAGYPTMPGIPGDSLNGVLSANELLTRCNLMRAQGVSGHTTRRCRSGRHVAVIGAGNTAMDAMRVSLRLGAEKVVLHLPPQQGRVSRARRGGASRRAGRRAVPLADQPGGDPRRRHAAACAACAACAWSSASRTTPAGGGRCRSPGSEHEIDTDLVVFAIGTNANPIMGQTSRLRAQQARLHQRPTTSLATSIAGVFAGGDIVTGAATVIEAMGAGRKAARSMKAYLGMRDAGRAVRGRPQPARHALRHRPARAQFRARARCEAHS